MNILKKYRESKNLTQTQFAAIIKWSQVDVCRAERNISRHIALSSSDARAIELATGGVVSRWELLYPDEADAAITTVQQQKAQACNE